MCFHISINSSKNNIENKFGATFDSNYEFIPSQNINGFSNPKVTVITSDRPKKIQFFNWGLIPHWIQNEEKAKLNEKLADFSQ